MASNQSHSEKVEPKKSLLKESVLLVIGGLLAILGGIVQNVLQSNAEVNRMVIERRLDVVRSFSLACNQYVSVHGQIRDVVEKYVYSTEYKPFVRADVDSLFDELSSAFAALQAEISIANALYGTDIRVESGEDIVIPSSGALTNELREQLRAAAEAINGEIKKTGAQCHSHTARLISSVGLGAQE